MLSVSQKEDVSMGTQASAGHEPEKDVPVGTQASAGHEPEKDVPVGTQASAGHEPEEEEFETLIEDISIDGMCGIY